MIDVGDMLRRYRIAIISSIVAISLAVWPALLTPVAQIYVRFCVRYLATAPFFHHLPPYAGAILLVGSATMALTATFLLVRQVRGQSRLRQRALARNQPIDSAWIALASAGRLTGRLVVTRDRQAYAFCAGLIFPRVYISAGLLDLLSPPEIDAVLRHEARHLQRHDPLRLFVANLLHVLFCPFPVFGALIERVRIGIELAADQAALEAVPLDVLASALLKAARADRGGRQFPVVAALTPTAARIDALLGRTVTMPISGRDLLVTGLVVLTVLGLLAHLAQIPLPMASTCPACATF